jgi:outer membrane lipoprotein carrier protein
VRALALGLALFVQTLPARTLPEVLKGVEDRYNRIRSLTLDFEQQHTAQGRKRLETGTLTLRKPGRMRWDYTQPAGKLFLSDGAWLWFHSPYSNRTEKARLKETDDLRAPLAFLLGKLDFRRSFSSFELREADGEAWLRALPKSENAPFTQVEFRIAADNSIRGILVGGLDGSTQEFRFRNERANAAVSDAAFRYTPAQGEEVVEVNSFGEAEQ